MATAAQVEAMVRAFAQGDADHFTAVARQVVAHERSVGRQAAAARIEAALGRVADRPALAELPSPPVDDRRNPLVRVGRPAAGWDRLAWEPATEAALRRVVAEHQASDRLAEHGLAPRNRLLFHGDPGNGKTAAAGVVAGVLGLPLVEVDMQGLLDAHIGVTGQNLVRVIEYVARFPCVAFFDEVDAVAMKREDDGSAAGREGNRMVAALIRCLDQLPPPTIVVAATNRPGLVDPAIARRFDLAVEFPVPSLCARELMCRRLLAGFAAAEDAARLVAERTAGKSGAAVERVALDAARTAVLAGAEEIEVVHVAA